LVYSPTMSMSIGEPKGIYAAFILSMLLPVLYAAGVGGSIGVVIWEIAGTTAFTISSHFMGIKSAVGILPIMVAIPFSGFFDYVYLPLLNIFVIGFAMGIYTRMSSKPKAIILTGVASAAVGVAVFAGDFSLRLTGIRELAKSELLSVVSYPQEMEKIASRAVEITTESLPAIFIFSSIIKVILVYYLASKLVSSLKPLPKLAKWHLPVWTLIVPVTGVTLISSGYDSIIHIISENILVFSLLLFAMGGVFFLESIFERRNVAVISRAIGYVVMLFLQGIFIPILALVGISDTAFNLRKLTKGEEDEGDTA